MKKKTLGYIYFSLFFFMHIFIVATGSAMTLSPHFHKINIHNEIHNNFHLENVAFNEIIDSDVSDDSYTLRKQSDTGSTGSNGINDCQPNGINQCDQLLFAHMLYVDQLNGDDVKALNNEKPFSTITAALQKAQRGDFVLVLPGIYNEILRIPEGVTVSGVSSNSVIIQKINVKIDTDLVVLHENSKLENVSLKLTSPIHVRLRGIIFENKSIETAQWYNSSLIIDNSAADVGISNVYGVYITGNNGIGSQQYALENNSIEIYSTGGGAKRGILAEQDGNLNINNVVIIAQGLATDSIGLESKHQNSNCFIHSSVISGSNADIWQHAGIISLFATNLKHTNANDCGFMTPCDNQYLIWSDSNTLPAAFNQFMGPGTAITGPTQVFVPIQQSSLIHGIRVHADFSPGIGETTEWIIKKNGIDTNLKVKLNDEQKDAENNNISIHFDKGDLISLKVNSSKFAVTSNVTVAMNIY